ncbi:MAG: FAD-dependent oxidoreductase [Chitinivibrionales bacterium]|nr:FAD-dependent oxidoreductase [Chitinivibrionales bacterium]
MSNPIKINATVSNLIDHGDKVYTVIFNTEKRVPRFKPGQFLHLALDEYDPCGGYWPDSRVFSIASQPLNNELTIIYSVKGKFTTRMSNELLPGKKIWLKLPYGSFIVDSYAAENEDILLVAGGTGISPYLSYLSNESPTKSVQRTTHLIYGIRKRSLLLCEDILLNLKKNNNFKLDLFLEEKTDGTDGSFCRNEFHPFYGQISDTHILNAIKTLSNPIVFLSGPPVMIARFKFLLLDNSIDTNRIKIDEWE